LFAAVFVAVVFTIVAVVAVLVIAGVRDLGVRGFVAPPGALADSGEGAFVAVLVFADVIAGGELVALGSLLGGLDSVGCIEFLLAIDELRCNLEPVEKGGRLLELDAVIDDGVVDADDGELDGGGIFGRGHLQGAVLEVRLRADGVDLGVVVTELTTSEGGGLAREPVGLDVPAFHVHGSILSPSPLPFSGKVVIPGGLAFWLLS
jgi:hypothetical protein